jgi:hypothetical protein
MRTFTFSTVVLVALLSSSVSFAAKSKKHHSKVPVTTSVLGTCEQQPKMCPQLVEGSDSCKAVNGKQSLEEGAYDSDNAVCIKMRLWKKICANGWASEKFKVTCR